MIFPSSAGVPPYASSNLPNLQPNPRRDAEGMKKCSRRCCLRADLFCLRPPCAFPPQTSRCDHHPQTSRCDHHPQASRCDHHPQASRPAHLPTFHPYSPTLGVSPRGWENVHAGAACVQTSFVCAHRAHSLRRPPAVTIIRDLPLRPSSAGVPPCVPSP